MHAMLEQKLLNDALKLVGRAVAARPVLPIHGHIYLEADAETQMLLLAATDGECHLRLWCRARVDSAGAATVPATLFQRLVSSLPAGPLALTGQPKQVTRLTAGRYTSQLFGLSPDDFPAWEQPQEVDAGRSMTLPGHALREMIGQTLFCAASDDARPGLSAARLEVTPDSIGMVALDGNRLAIRRFANDTAAPELAVLLPRGPLTDVQAAMDLLKPADVTLRLNERYFEFHMLALDDEPDSLPLVAELRSALLAHRYPDYMAVVPVDQGVSATLETRELTQAVRVANLFVDEDKTVALSVSQTEDGTGHGIVRVASSSGLHGDSCVEIKADVAGDRFAILLNGRYLHEFCVAIAGSERITIEGRGPERGLVCYRDDLPKNEYLHMIMPLRGADPERVIERARTWPAAPVAPTPVTVNLEDRYAPAAV